MVNFRASRTSELSQSFLRFFNRCPGCGTSAPVYCEACWETLQDRDPKQAPDLPVVMQQPFMMRALWTWREGLEAPQNRIQRSEIIRRSVLFAKERPNRDLIRVWASELYLSATIAGLMGSKLKWWIIVPPSVQFRQNGHAKELGRELSRLAGMPFREFPILEQKMKNLNLAQSLFGTRLFGGNQLQKSKSRVERREYEMALSSNLSDSQRAQIEAAPGYLFVDDVIVTGSTAVAAWSALGKPKNFEAWAMAWRTKDETNGREGSL